MVAEWVLAGATAVLAIATGVLAWFARALYRATKELTHIERARDTRATLRERQARAAYPRTVALSGDSRSTRSTSLRVAGSRRV